MSFIQPTQVLDKLKLKEDMIAAEFGCGSGGFTIPLAKRLNKGRVYGLDVQKEPLSALEGRASLEGLNNIETKRCDLEQEKGSNLPPKFLDLVLIPNVLFQVEDERPLIKEAKRILKDNGQLLIIDWLEDVEVGPKGDRESAATIKSLAEEEGFKLKQQFKPGNYHWGLILKA